MCPHTAHVICCTFLDSCSPSNDLDDLNGFIRKLLYSISSILALPNYRYISLLELVNVNLKTLRKHSRIIPFFHISKCKIR